MSLRPMIGICALALVTGACASGGSSSAPAAASGASSTTVRRGNANLITESEIAGSTWKRLRCHRAVAPTCCAPAARSAA